MYPALDESLRPYFPPFIFKAAVPADYPPSVDQKLGLIFKQNGLSARTVFNKVHTAITKLMRVQTTVKETFHADPDPFYRLIATTSLPWQPGSRNKSRDYWAIAGGALYESLAFKEYRPASLKKAAGHIHIAMEKIILDHIVGRCTVHPETGDIFTVKEYVWVDRLVTPKEEDLAPLEDMNMLDIEAIFKWHMARLKLRYEVQSMINLVQNLNCATVS